MDKADARRGSYEQEKLWAYLVPTNHTERLRTPHRHTFDHLQFCVTCELPASVIVDRLYTRVLELEAMR